MNWEWISKINNEWAALSALFLVTAISLKYIKDKILQYLVLIGGIALSSLLIILHNNQVEAEIDSRASEKSIACAMKSKQINEMLSYCQIERDTMKNKINDYISMIQNYKYSKIKLEESLKEYKRRCSSLEKENRNNDNCYSYPPSDGLCLTKNHNLKKYGYKSPDGRLVIKYNFIAASNFHNGMAGVCKDNEKWGYIDHSGDTVIPCKFDKAYSFEKNGTAKVVQNGKEFRIYKNGEFVKSLNTVRYASN